MSVADDTVAACEAHLARGEPLAACALAQQALAAEPAHRRLRQLHALGLARSGDDRGARECLEALAAEGADDAETLGLLARTHKDMGTRATGTERRTHFARAFALYRDAAERTAARGDAGGATYPGINAASLARVLGDDAAAHALAGRVLAWSEKLDTGPWSHFTRGEAALLLDDLAGARAHYEQGARAAAGRWGDLASARRQLRLLAPHLADGAAAIRDVLRMPAVMAFTGHMIDAPGRATPRFPPGEEAAVGARIRQRVARLAPLAAYGSAACGADLLFLEAARGVKAETHIVLPFPADDFREASVAFAGDTWRRRFEAALDAADSVTVTSPHRATGSAATFEFANLVLTGMARLRAGTLEAPLLGLAACSEEASPRPGGSAWTLARWRSAGLDVERIPVGASDASTAVGAAAPEGVRHELRAMLFADAVGYSKLSEDQIPRYIEGFLGAIARLARESGDPFEHVETAGDGLYMVFPDVDRAGRFALALSAVVRAFDRAAWGLPEGFGMRIALHCGPVHRARDPISGRPLYTGPHTSRAARIEPVTPPGLVYASGEFAAVAAACGCDFDLAYVGPVPLAKAYGTIPLYHLRAARGPGALA